MYPTKSAYDYMTEMNRLFPRTTENDVYQSPNAMSNQSLFSPVQSTPANRSSSSADSLSPDSFPDMSHRSDTDRPAYDTSYMVRRQRPIIGRRIFDNPEPLPPLKPIMKTFDHDIEFPNSIWQPEDHHLFTPTPPRIRVEQKNVCYELFPTENRGFKPPISSLSPVSHYTSASPTFTSASPTFTSASPTFTSASPKFTTASPNFTPASPMFSPTLQQTPCSAKAVPPRMPTSPFRVPSRPNFGPCSSRHQEVRPSKMCTFCRKNGETPLVYMTHTVRENVGNKNVVTCPILRSHVCSTCGASGDNAHTITYCPVLRSSNNGRPLQSTTITLKNTRLKSNGRRRF